MQIEEQASGMLPLDLMYLYVVFVGFCNARLGRLTLLILRISMADFSNYRYLADSAAVPTSAWMWVPDRKAVGRGCKSVKGKFDSRFIE